MKKGRILKGKGNNADNGKIYADWSKKLREITST